MKWAFVAHSQYTKVQKSVGIGKALRQKAERKQSKRVGADMDRSAVLNKLTEQYLYSSTQILSRQYWSTYKEVLEILSLHFLNLYPISSFHCDRILLLPDTTLPMPTYL
jgi:hypothetical protein